MNGVKVSARAALDRLIQHYFDEQWARALPVITAARDAANATVPALDDRLNGVEQRFGPVERRLDEIEQRQRELKGDFEGLGRTVAQDLEALGNRVGDELRGSEERSQLIFSQQFEAFANRMSDELRGSEERSQLIFSQQFEAFANRMSDELRGSEERSQLIFSQQFEAFANRMSDELRGSEERSGMAFEGHADRVVRQLEGQAARQAELRGAMDDQAAAVESLVRRFEDRVDKLRSDLVELSRMLRMQGDAADQVAEVLGRTIARLSTEVDQLSEALHATTPGTLPPA